MHHHTITKPACRSVPKAKRRRAGPWALDVVFFGVAQRYQHDQSTDDTDTCVDAGGMAHQAILAADRRRKKEGADKACGNLSEDDLGVKALLGVLDQQKRKLGKAFEMWDSDGNGTLDKQELRSALFMLGIKPTQKDLDAFFNLFSEEKQKEGVALEDLRMLLEGDSDEQNKQSRSLPLRVVYGLYDLINTMAVQTLLYLAFVVLFQLLTDTLRSDPHITALYPFAPPPLLSTLST